MVCSLAFGGKCWISFEPTPPDKIDLAGEWTPSSDGLNYGAPITLPGKFDGTLLQAIDLR